MMLVMLLSADHGGNRWTSIPNSKGRRFDSHRGQAYFSSSPGVDIHSE
jgi:hypothetical protein